MIAIAGDGGAQMTINELSTAKQLGCNILYIVFNNNLLGRVHFGFHDVEGDYIASPDFAALAEAHGGKGWHVRGPEDVGRALEEAMAFNGVSIVEVTTDPTLKAEMAPLRDMSNFVRRLQSELGDLLPATLLSQDIRKLIQFDFDNDGLLSEQELASARRAISRFRNAPDELLNLLRSGQFFKQGNLTMVKELMLPLDPSPIVLSSDERKEGDSVDLELIGSVGDVLNGTIREELETKSWDASSFSSGFGAASVAGIEAYGESMVVNGHVFARSTDSESPNFYSTQVASKFVSPALICLPSSAAPAFRLEYRGGKNSGGGGGDGQEGMSLSRFVNDVYYQTRTPLYFQGRARFLRADVWALSEAPMKGKRLPDHKSFNMNPGAVLQDCEAFITGVVAMEGGQDSPQSMQDVMFQRMFYKAYMTSGDDDATNAVAKEVLETMKKPIFCHAHVLHLREPVREAQEVTPDKVVGVWHLNADSRLELAELEVFPIGGLVDAPPDK